MPRRLRRRSSASTCASGVRWPTSCLSQIATHCATRSTDWGFDVAPSETALASRESRRATADEFVLRRQLEGVAGYDVVLIDCPPSLGVLTLNALAAASRLVVVTEPSFLALQGIGELLETQELVRAHYNEGLALGGRKPPRPHPASPPASGAIAGSAELRVTTPEW